jgi:Tfp pilus assembly protein PilN
VINLLPPDIKQSYRYAHRNVSLLRWVIISGVCFFVIGLIGSYGWLTMRSAIATNNKEISTIQNNLKMSNLDETNKKIVEISDSFKLVEQVLSEEILFSQLLRQMATALPNGTYLSKLNIATVSSGSALDVAVDATSYDAAAQVQLNLADPDNQIFARADIQNIACDDTSSTNPRYPCKITLRAQFADNNQFLFINQGTQE